MRTLWGTLLMMVFTTVLIFVVPTMFEPEMQTRTIALEHGPMLPEGDAPTAAPAPRSPGLIENIVTTTIDNVQKLFWALVQAILIARYVRKRSG